jgi:diadenosine tetraphosphate (Ap4A) HIT family hydrolase
MNKKKPTTDLFSEDNQLNARLRGEYDQIAATVENDRCVFCDLKQKYILFEKNGLVVTVNLYPYIDGQLLIIPRRHVENYHELTVDEIKTNFELTKMAMTALRQQMGIQGMWLILRDGDKGSASGKTVKHLHWNILPYTNDLNTWHYQKLTITPINLAEKLRRFFKNERD